MNNSQFPDSLQFIAHRGYQKYYPENTCLSIQQAIKAGSKWVEFDIQFTLDGHAVLYHDRDLQRLSAENGSIDQLVLDQTASVSAYEPERFGSQFRGEKIASLARIVELLTQHVEVNCFVEVKRVCLEHQKNEFIIDYLTKTLSPIIKRCIMISFDIDIIEYAKTRGWQRYGVVVSQWQQIHQQSMMALNPEFVFCNFEKLPDSGSLTPPVGKLAVYEIADIDLALALYRRGVSFVETFAVGEMLEALAKRNAD